MFYLLIHGNLKRNNLKICTKFCFLLLLVFILNGQETPLGNLFKVSFYLNIYMWGNFENFIYFWHDTVPMQSVFITTIDEDLITAQRMVYLIQVYVIKFVSGLFDELLFPQSKKNWPP